MGLENGALPLEFPVLFYIFHQAEGKPKFSQLCFVLHTDDKYKIKFAYK